MPRKKAADKSHTSSKPRIPADRTGFLSEKRLSIVFARRSEPAALIDSKLKLIVCNSLFSNLLKHPEKK